jgi:RNA polymerase sigma factor (sigma-70 family)
MTRDPAASLPRYIRRLAAADLSAPAPDDDCLTRFTARGDEAAFETLVRRHGPMVLRVCRATLGDAHAAEDAFQATFLTLARRAGTLRKQHSLASWLYRVARRVAAKAGERSAERRRREAAVSRRPSADPLAEVSWREVQAIFLDEIDKLSACYRAPLQLCCLEGKTRDEAAEQLGCAAGTLKIQLERGRKLLRARLARRGLGLSAGLLAVRLTPAGARAAVPESLTAATVRAGAAVRVDGAVAGLVSARVLSLSEKAGRAAIFDRLKTVLAMALLCGACVAGGVSLLFREGAAAAPPDTPAPAERPAVVTESARTDQMGDPLPADALSRFGTLRLRHGNFVSSAQFTPDGETLVSAGWDGVRTWEVATGKQVHALAVKAPVGWPADVRLTADGKYLFGADGKGIHQWEVATGKCVHSLAGYKCQLMGVSPDGKLIAAFPWNAPHRIEVLEVDSGKTLWSRDPGKVPPVAMTFSPDGRTVVAYGPAGLQFPPRTDNVIYLLDARSGKERRRIEPGPWTPSRVVLSPDGTRLAALCSRYKDQKSSESRLYVVDIAGGKDLLPIDPPGGKIAFEGGYFSAVAFTPGGRSLVAAGDGPDLIEWDSETGKELRHFGRDAMSANGLALSPDGKTVAVAGPESAIRLVDRESGRDVIPGPANSFRIYDCGITPDGGTVVTPGPGPTLYFWDPTTGRIRNRLGLEASAYWSYQVAGDGKTAFASEYLGKTIVVRELPSGKVRSHLTLDIPDKGATLQAVSRDGKTVAVRAYTSDTFYLFDTASGKHLKRLQDPAFTGSKASFTADGRTCFVFCPDRTTQVWDVAGGSRLRRIGPLGEPRSDRPPRPVPVGGVQEVTYAAAASPDGTRIAVGDEAGHLLLIDADTGRELRRVDKSDTDRAFFTFSPDGRTVAWSTVEDPAIRLVEVASGRDRHSFHGHRGPAPLLAFSADGEVLVSGSTDATALVWDLTGRLAAGKVWDKPLSPAELDALWIALAGDDAAKAYAAVQRLAASDNAVGYLRERLRPVTPADEKLLARLIADLDGDRFEVREKATSDLEKLGEVAIVACRKALAGSPSAEVRRRLEAIVTQWEQEQRTVSGDALRAMRALEVLERAGTPEARRLLEAIAGGTSGFRLTREAKASAERLAKRTPVP